MADAVELAEHIALLGLERALKIYYGIYRATCVDNHDPEFRGRIRIACPEAGHDSIKGLENVWVDPLFEGSGPDIGSFYPPIQGALVRCFFLNGKPESPIGYFGGWYTQTGTKQGCPSEFKYASDGTPQRRGFITRAGHMLIFDDEPGSESVKIIWHKCLAADTLIPVLTNDGLHRLRPEEIEPGDQVVSVDGVPRLAEVEAVGPSGYRERMIRITLADGNTACVTEDHRIPVEGGDLREARTLTLVDRVLVATRFPLPLVDGEPDDYNWGRLAGVWLGDGSFSSARANLVRFHLSRAKIATVQFVKRFLVDRFVAKVGEYLPTGSQSIELAVFDARLRGFLEATFEGRTAKTKRISPATFLRSAWFVYGLRDGFCETDGSFDDQARWRFNQSNAELLRDFSILLKTLGIPSKTRSVRQVPANALVAAHESYPFEFREEINRHHNSTFRSEKGGVCPVRIVAIETVEGCETWDLAVCSASHLFAVDHGMLVHNCDPSDPALTDFTKSADRTKGKFATITVDNTGSLQVVNSKGSMFVLDSTEQHALLVDENGNSVTTDPDGIKLIDFNGNLLSLDAKAGSLNVIVSGDMNFTGKTANFKVGGVFLGDGAPLSSVLGEPLMAWLAAHNHLTGVGPSSPAAAGLVGPPPPSILSLNVKLR